MKPAPKKEARFPHRRGVVSADVSQRVGPGVRALEAESLRGGGHLTLAPRPLLCARETTRNDAKRRDISTKFSPIRPESVLTNHLFSYIIERAGQFKTEHHNR
jgi:hypothetical protein